MSDVLQLDIVSAEELLYSAQVDSVFVMGSQGELGIYPGHSQLLTTLKPGYVRVLQNGAEAEVFYVSSGVLEIQPKIVTILADSALRAGDIDEAAALEAQKRAQTLLANKQTTIDYAQVLIELAEAVAQVRAIRHLRKGAKK